MALDLLPYLIATGAQNASVSTTMTVTVGDGGGWPAIPGDRIFFAGGSGGAQPTGCSDSQGTGYTKLAGTGTTPASSLWTGVAPATLKGPLTGYTADTLTVTYSGTGQAKQWIAMGCSNLGALDQAAAPATGNSAAPSIASAVPAVSGELFVVLVLHQNAGGTIGDVTGWHTIAKNVTTGTNSLASMFVKVGGSGALTFTGALTSATGWTCQLCAYKPAAQSLKMGVGASIFSGAYPGLGLSNTGAHNRFNGVVGRSCDSLKRYLAEDSWPSSGNDAQSVVDWTLNQGCLCVVSIKPRRAVAGGTASSLTGMKNALIYWKNNGIVPQLIFGNEANINGGSGPFGTGTGKDWDYPSPYGTSVSGTQAATNFLNWFGYYAPTAISAGFQCQYNPAISSSVSALNFMPPRLDSKGWPLLTGVSIDYYYTGDYRNNGITMTAVMNACAAMTPVCPVGVGETGATDGTERPLADTPSGSLAGLVNWMDNQLTAPLANWAAGGGQLLPALWYANGTGNSIDYGQAGGVIAAFDRFYDALDPGGTQIAASAAKTSAASAVLSGGKLALAATADTTPVMTAGAVLSGGAIPMASAAATVSYGQAVLLNPADDPSSQPAEGAVQAVADSLVLGGVIELLGDTVPSAHPACPGAIFRLGRDFDLSAPAMTTEQVAGLLLDGEVMIGQRASNRTPRLPVVITVPPSGDLDADRAILAGARELLLHLAGQERWTLVWTREGALPLVWDCQGLSSTTVTYSLIYERNLISQLEIEFAAFPFGRSDDPEQIQFNAASQIWDQPPAPVTVDDFTTGPNYLSGDDTGFNASTGNWTQAGGCSIGWTAAQFHTGPGSMALTAAGTSNMQAASGLAQGFTTDPPSVPMMPCQPGDSLTLGAYSRAATVARSVNVGAEIFDSYGTTIATLRGSNVTNATGNFNAHPVATVTAPAGSAWVRVNAQVLAPAGAGEVHYFDDITLSRTVWSLVDPAEWTSSATSPLAAFRSARWSRRPGDHPVYDRVLAAPLDITGRGKISFWAGLASASAAYHVWHKGWVSYLITLTDGNAYSITFGVKQQQQASALDTLPHWSRISVQIPQDAQFDFTTLTEYRIEAWNDQDPFTHEPVLQASFYLSAVQAVATSTGAAAARSALFVLPGIIGTARAPLALQIAPGLTSFSSVATFTTVGSNNWTAPTAPAVSSIDKVECWGGGGGGSASNNPSGDRENPGGGGGGGEYSMNRNVPVTPGGLYHPVVGAGGSNGTYNNSDNDATSGGDSYFTGDSGNQTTAHGGIRGYKLTPGSGGMGGAGSTAYLHYPGGDGFPANHVWDKTGGGGGGSAGTGSAGKDSGGAQGGLAVTGGGAGGQGGGAASSDYHTGRSGTAPGGGGAGGAMYNHQTYGGGSGARGQVRLSYGATGLAPLASFLVHAPQPTAPAAFNPVCAVGSGADAPDGREYTIPALNQLAARFDGSYTIYLVAVTWNTPASARTVTVQVRQYPYSGGTAVLAPALTRSITPSADITNGYCDMGAITLPLHDLAPGNTDAYFTVSVTSSNASDRFLDVLFIDSQGQLVLVNMPGTAWCNMAWVDEADRDRDLGRVLGSDTDRDRARSLLPWTDRLSGGPLSVTPDADNRLLIYAAQGVPSLTGWYAPRWWTERLA